MSFAQCCQKPVFSDWAYFPDIETKTEKKRKTKKKLNISVIDCRWS